MWTMKKAYVILNLKIYIASIGKINEAIQFAFLSVIKILPSLACGS